MTRLLTAAILIAVLVGALLARPAVFIVLVVLVVVLAWHEYARLAQAVGALPVSAPGALMSAAVAASFAAPRPSTMVAVLVAAILASALACLRDHYRDPSGLVRALAATISGMIWIGMLLGCQIGIRTLPAGVAWLLLLYGSVAVGDSAAYYGGTAFGRHKLAPHLSPNKTIEGSAFGLAGSALAAVAAAYLLLPGLMPATAALLGVVLGLCGQVGDLLESALKRAAGKKDSSGLLPGHGGVLDRIDAHLLAGGALWAILTLGWLT